MVSKHYEHPTVTGCSDGGCIIKRPIGMHTNGGCMCEKEIRRAPKGFEAIQTIHYLRRELKAANEFIDAIKGLSNGGSTDGE